MVADRLRLWPPGTVGKTGAPLSMKTIRDGASVFYERIRDIWTKQDTA